MLWLMVGPLTSAYGTRLAKRTTTDFGLSLIHRRWAVPPRLYLSFNADIRVHSIVKSKEGIYIALCYALCLTVLRYGPCVTRGSYSFTCHSHTNHTCLYSPATRHHHTLAGTHSYIFVYCVIVIKWIMFAWIFEHTTELSTQVPLSM